MSEYTLKRSGTIHIDSTVNAGASPVDVALPGDAIKTASSFLVATVRDRRRGVLRQRGTIAITNADPGPTKDAAALGTPVDVTAAYIIAQLREKRTDGYQGATLDFSSSTVVQATFHQPAAGDTIDVDFQVVEHRSRRGATVKILDQETVRVTFDGPLVASESIDVDYYVFDYDNAGDDIKEVLFRELQILGLEGYAKIQDLCVYDTPGNLVSYRVRAFDTAAHAADATVDLVAGSGLETGEISRFLVTVDIDKDSNDRKSLIAVRVDDIMTNPDID